MKRTLITLAAGFALSLPLLASAQSPYVTGSSGEAAVLPPPNADPSGIRMSNEQIRVIADILSHHAGKPLSADTIRAEIIADPLSSGMTSAQVDQMENALSKNFTGQRVAAPAGSPAVIPQAPPRTDNAAQSSVTQSAENTCSGLPVFLCSMSSAFGFLGNDPTVPVSLFDASGAFLLVTYLMYRNRRSGPIPK